MPAVSPIVHARSAQVGIGERESRRYWGQQLVVRGQLHSPMGKLVMRAAHVAPIRARCFNSKRTSFHVALELEHMESVDLRSEIRKADAVLPVFARAGQRSDTLKRVARRGGCRLLFRLGVQHISHRAGGRACRLEQSQTLIPGRSRAAAASMVAPQAAGLRYEAGKGLLQLYCVGWSTFASSFGCAGMLFWWAPWHGGVAGIRQDRHWSVEYDSD